MELICSVIVQAITRIASCCFPFHFLVKPALSGHSKRTPKIGFRYQLLLNAGQKYCRMLPLEHSAILLTFIKLPFSIKTFILSIFKWPLKTGFTVVTITPDMEPSLDYTVDLSSKYMS